MRVPSLAGKWFLHKGQRVEINNVAIQRREDQWGGQFGDPCKYNPERFMPGQPLYTALVHFPSPLFVSFCGPPFFPFLILSHSAWLNSSMFHAFLTLPLTLFSLL